MILFGSILTTAGAVFENLLEPKIEQPLKNLACPNPWHNLKNILSMKVQISHGHRLRRLLCSCDASGDEDQWSGCRELLLSTQNWPLPAPLLLSDTPTKEQWSKSARKIEQIRSKVRISNILSTKGEYFWNFNFFIRFHPFGH